MKPSGFWKNQANVVKETRKAARLLQTAPFMPSERELRKKKLSSLAIAITDHGGFPRFAKKCGLIPRRVPNGHYDSIQVLASDLRKLAQELRQAGVMPTSTQLRTQRLFSIMSAIDRHGGFFRVGDLASLQTDHLRKPNGHYADFANVAREVVDAVKQTSNLGQMPSSGELSSLGRSGLTVGIIRHGGFHAVASRLGLKPGRMPNGYWNDATIKQHVASFIAEFGQRGVFPTGSELRLNDRADLEVAISRHGGSYRFARLLKLRVTKGQEPGYWQKPGVLKGEVLAFIRKHGTAGKMPTQQAFVAHGRPDINNALFRYGGGHSAFAASLGLAINERPKRYWRDFSNLQLELVQFNQIFGYDGQMPSSPQLREAGFAALDSAISNVWGGYFKVAERLGWSSVNMSLWPRSEIELRIAHELQAVIDFDIEQQEPLSHRKIGCPNPKCDMVVPKLRLVVEFDSWKWHSGLNPRGVERFDLDSQKSELLRNEGWTVIRIRERPLELTHKHDVSVGTSKLKSICDAVIRRICKLTDLSLNDRRVRRYLAAPSPLRTDAARGCINKKLERRRGQAATRRRA
jgi:hypothetical protein